MSFANSISIDLHRRNGGPHDVLIRSRRPVHAARTLQGRSPAEAATLVRQLFTVCGVAQGVACRHALRQASGAELEAPTVSDRRALLLETVREHLWRVLVDWAEHIGSVVDADSLRRCRLLGDDARPDDVARQLRNSVFGVSLQRWLDIEHVNDLLVWARTTDTVAARMIETLNRRGWCMAGASELPFLPDTPAEDLHDTLASPDADLFIEQPVWTDGPHETSPLARTQHSVLIRSVQAQFGRGLLARHVALLVELAEAPSRLNSPSPRRISSASLPPATGLAQVDAARGRLVHRVVIDDGRIDTYQIVAPTEWNFHPDGVLAKSLAALDHGNREQLAEQATLLVKAVDPCVGFELEVH